MISSNFLALVSLTTNEFYVLTACCFIVSNFRLSFIAFCWLVGWLLVRLFIVPPRFLLKFQSEAVRLGEEALLKCEADGETPMTISWFVNKEPISASDENRYQRTEEVGERSLRLV